MNKAMSKRFDKFLVEDGDTYAQGTRADIDVGRTKQFIDKEITRARLEAREIILSNLLIEFENKSWNAKCRKAGVAHIESLLTNGAKTVEKG